MNNLAFELSPLVSVAARVEFPDPQAFFENLLAVRTNSVVEKLKSSSDWQTARAAHAESLEEGEEQTDDLIVAHGLEMGLFKSAEALAEEARIASLPTLEELRAQTTIPKGDFCLGLIPSGVLTSSEAIEGAKGNWPHKFDPFIASLPEEQATKIQVDWATTTVVHRGNPMIEPLAVMANIPLPALDALFGITPEMYRADD